MIKRLFIGLGYGISINEQSSQKGFYLQGDVILIPQFLKLGKQIFSI